MIEVINLDNITNFDEDVWQDSFLSASHSGEPGN